MPQQVRPMRSEVSVEILQIDPRGM
jgi:hypothetical protein